MVDHFDAYVCSLGNNTALDSHMSAQRKSCGLSVLIVHAARVMDTLVYTAVDKFGCPIFHTNAKLFEAQLCVWIVCQVHFMTLLIV